MVGFCPHSAGQISWIFRLHFRLNFFMSTLCKHHAWLKRSLLALLPRSKDIHFTFNSVGALSIGLILICLFFITMAFTGAMFGNIDASMGVNNDGTTGGAMGVAGGPFDPVAMTANSGLNRQGLPPLVTHHGGPTASGLKSV